MRLLCEVVLVFVLAFCQAQIYYPTDEICESKTGQKRCVDVSRCLNFTRKYQLDDYPKPCALQGKHSFVCCETTDIKLLPGTKSLNECDKFYERTPLGPDGKLNYDDFQGPQDTLTEDFPHMAALGIQINDTINWICAGSLISRKFILTAASCLQHPNGTINLIRLGDLKLNSDSDDVEPQSFRVSRMIIHPKFSPPALYNDIGLIELDGTANITSYVKPACLQTTKEIREYRYFVAGYQTSEAKLVNQLYTVESRGGYNITCGFYFNKTGMFNETLPQGFDDEMQICSKTNMLTAPCLTDTGGPLLYANLQYTDGRWIIGVTSFAKPCTSDIVPGIYTRISYYIPWIEAHIF